MNLDTENGVRDFLRLCLDPGHGIKRTPAKLAAVMPGPLEEALMRFAPHLGDLRAEADRQEAEARKARKAYTDALAAWITGDHSAHERDHIDGVPWPQCLNCSTEAHTVDWTVPGPEWRDDSEAPAYRTPDGRVWKLIAERSANGHPLYEGRGGIRYTALALEVTYGEITAVAGARPECAGTAIKVGCRAGETPADDSPALCPQNRRGDQRVMQAHFYKPDADGVLRCLFCSAPAHWGGEPSRAYRTPDGRVWTQANEVDEHGVTLYEAPYVPQRYTALALETMYAEQGDTEPVDDVKAPVYVHNARSVNRAPGTAVKHIPDGHGRTICPSQFQASQPLPEEEAAQFALCNGCRRTLLARHDVAEDPQPA
ncbi:hypothetical protein ACIOHS_26875 [Streptomyces sp. NPDC088253]|uniref:hypothetical protein n=1 Tax=Streptomyces sp. NPDC088253 TaxID=3365846 RepID=UPI00382CC697